MFLLGTLNNFGYVVVNSNAQDLAESFDALNLLSLIPWANVAFGFGARGLNAFVLERLPHKWRIVANAGLLLLGLIGLAMSVYINFYFALFSIVLIGASSSFGESVLLGYMQQYPPKLVDGWSSGTGMAGVAGSLVYLVMAAVGFSNLMVYLSLIPLAFIYVFIFFFVLSPPLSKDNHQVKFSVNEDPQDKDGAKGALLGEIGAATEEVPEGAFARVLRCSRIVFWLASQLALVYFFEYVISTGGASLANNVTSDSSWEVKNAYAILAFCYQFGVLISRSSLSIIKFKWVEILTVLQYANFILWMCQDYWKFMNIWVQFASMVFVGLLGGASYVNVFYLILHEDHIPNKDREMCVNLAAISITLGITVACIFGLFSANTFLKDV
eukprot:TRINITY_DN1450_c2_g1_i1.p1 TRINITY_DN1450_c2_g1~~TRINITY_DN1450_c2_g1_i1.p1  ORF type:complete len:433 (-),score=100.92 TRINITY_DN1450_c2_g1_i1:89-1240(-)